MKMSEVQKLSEEFKKTNGNSNVTYSVKELIQSLHVKMDNFITTNRADHKVIFDRLEDGNKRFATINYVNWIFGITMTLLGALAAYVII